MEAEGDAPGKVHGGDNCAGKVSGVDDHEVAGVGGGVPYVIEEPTVIFGSAVWIGNKHGFSGATVGPVTVHL